MKASKIQMITDSNGIIHEFKSLMPSENQSK